MPDRGPPGFLPLMLPRLTAKPPAGPGWQHEIKYDGYRLQGRTGGGRPTLRTRSGLDWTKRFAPIARALAALDRSAVLDGEVVVEDAAGISDFTALQAALAAGDTGGMRYHIFDLLQLEGEDLRPLPLETRQARLATLLAGLPEGSPIRPVEHLDDGDAMFRHACRLGLEGIVSKKLGSSYRAGKDEAWRKVKCVLRQEFVILGYRPSSTVRGAVGSLEVGSLKDGAVQVLGQVGTGFSAAGARALWQALEAIRLEAPAAQGTRKVRPVLLAEIEYRGWTANGELRHAVYKGLREDKPAGEVRIEGAPPRSAARAAPAFRLTHPDRVLWPDIGLTKLGLAQYVEEAGDHLLAHVAGRPLSLVRCPSGSEAKCFYAKHPWAGLGDEVGRIRIDGKEHLVVSDRAGLLALVQSGVLEIHPWGATAADPEHPDRLTIDLDPGPDVPWEAVVAAAVEVRDRLSGLGLTGFVKTTGGKGLHVVAPLRPTRGWEDVAAFARSLAGAMASDGPDLYVATMAKRLRGGRIFIDWLRNTRGATAVAAYSPRARPGAPVSTPLGWEELSGGLRPAQFTVATMPRRLGMEPWAGWEAARRGPG